ncbi:MAG: hypothetical protein Q8880_02605 [Bacteroidota bacterium]|nr:hypothetical protein [Bacteroidota bacterium]
MNYNNSRSQVGPYLAFDMKVQPDIDFTFSSINDYITGITRLNAMTLYVNSVADPSGLPGSFQGQWDLYVNANTTVAGQWDDSGIYYSGSGNIPTVDILEVRVKNTDNTPKILNFFNLSSAPTYLIGSAANPDPAVACGPNLNTNTAGSYKTLPQCYKFNVDFRIKPGLSNNIRLGYYKIAVEFTISSDL